MALCQSCVKGFFLGCLDLACFLALSHPCGIQQCLPCLDCVLWVIVICRSAWLCTCTIMPIVSHAIVPACLLLELAVCCFTQKTACKGPNCGHVCYYTALVPAWQLGIDQQSIWLLCKDVCCCVMVGMKVTMTMTCCPSELQGQNPSSYLVMCLPQPGVSLLAAKVCWPATGCRATSRSSGQRFVHHPLAERQFNLG